MNLPLIVLDCAAIDLKKAIDEYDKLVPGLGESLYWHVAETIDFIEANPRSYQIDFGAFRRAPTHRFPFCVYYRVSPQIIEVVAILDCRRNPLTIRSEVRSRH